jgi:hypothetical protein
MMNRDLEGKGRGLILRYSPDIFVEGLGKITKNFYQGSQSPNRDLNPGPFEYEAWV